MRDSPVTDVATIVDIASKIGTISGLLLILWGGVTRKWVFGWLYDQMVAAYDVRLAAKDAEIQEWKQRALEQAGLNKATVDSLQKLVAQAASRRTNEKTAPGGTGAPS